jgi:hypothetical protein
MVVFHCCGDLLLLVGGVGDVNRETRAVLMQRLEAVEAALVPLTDRSTTPSGLSVSHEG